MDGTSVSHLPSEEEELPPIVLSQIFKDQYPYYIHLGMSYNEYWRMDCELVRAYRQAYEYRQEYDNSMLWLQGLYVYNAIEAQRPGWVFYGKRTPKPGKYMDKPIAVTKKLQDEYASEKTRKMAEQFKSAFRKKNEKLDARPEVGDSNGERRES